MCSGHIVSYQVALVHIKSYGIPEQSSYEGAVVYMKLYCVPEQSSYQGAVVCMKSAFVDDLRVQFPFGLFYFIL
jgi:hypothetical protein